MVTSPRSLVVENKTHLFPSIPSGPWPCTGLALSAPRSIHRPPIPCTALLVENQCVLPASWAPQSLPSLFLSGWHWKRCQLFNSQLAKYRTTLCLKAKALGAFDWTSKWTVLLARAQWERRLNESSQRLTKTGLNHPSLKAIRRGLSQCYGAQSMCYLESCSNFLK